MWTSHREAYFAFAYFPEGTTSVTRTVSGSGSFGTLDMSVSVKYGNSAPLDQPVVALSGFYGGNDDTPKTAVSDVTIPAGKSGWYNTQIDTAYLYAAPEDPAIWTVDLAYNNSAACQRDKAEVACLCNPAGIVTDGTAYKGDPISTGYGNATESEVDLSIGSRSGSLRVSRSYNSIAGTTDSPFGYGWSWSFGSRLLFNQPTTGEIKLIQPSGVPAVFSPLIVSPGSTAQYAAAPWVSASLVKSPVDGSFTVTMKDGTKYGYAAEGGNANGRLTGITNRDTYAATLGYNADGTLASVTDSSSNRALSFGWNSAKNRVVSVTDQAAPTARSVVYSYDPVTNDLVQVTDVAGNKHGYGYEVVNNVHRLKWLRSPKQANAVPVDTTRDVVNVYDSNNRVVSQTDNRLSPPRVTAFDYAASGYPAQDPVIPNGATVITIKAVGAPTADYTRADFYTNGQRTKVEEGVGSDKSTRRFTYDPGTGGVTSVEVWLPATSTWVPESAFTYDYLGNRLSATQGSLGDGSARTTLFTLIEKPDPNNSNTWVRWGYNSFGQPLRVVDPAGVVTTAVYDQFGNPVSVCTPIAAAGPPAGSTLGCTGSGASTTTGVMATTTMGYDPARPGDLLWVRDANHQSGAQDQTNSTRFAYNAATGYRESVTEIVTPESQVRTPASASGNRTTFSYDNVGRLLTTVSPKGNRAGANPADFTTDFRPATAYGDPETITDPLGGVTKRHFDFNHNVDWTQPADGNCTSTPKVKCTEYVYDDANQLLVTQKPEPGTNETNEWTAAGRLKTQKDGLNNPTAYTYDTAGRAKSVTDPNLRATVYGYDPYGRTATVLQPGPGGTCAAVGPVNCVKYGYNTASQLTSITYSDGVTPNVGPITYDTAGRRSAAPQVGVGGTAYTWDTAGRMTGSTTAGESIGYGWDPAGNMTTITYPGAGATCTAQTKVLCVARSFDAANRLASITDFNNKTTTYDLDDNSNYKKVTYPTSTASSDTFNFDRADRMASTTAPVTPAISYASGANTATVDYTRTATGALASQGVNGLAVAGGGTGPGTNNYGYDGNNRLCYVATSAGTNPTCATPPAGAGTYTYDGANNLTKKANGTEFKSDPANQLCYSIFGSASAPCTPPPAGSTTGYGFDARGNRTSVTPPVTSSLPSAFTYDQANRMTKAVVPASLGNQGEYAPLGIPARIMDTRNPGPCPNGVCAKIAHGATVTLTVKGAGGLPASGIAAVVVELGATAGTGAGFLTAYSPDTALPSTSNLNYAAGQTITNAAVIKVGTGANDGKINIYNSGPGDVDVIVDAHGSYSAWSGTAGGTFNRVDPVRLSPAPVTIAGGTYQDILVAGATGTTIPTTGVGALTANLTVTNGTAAGNLTAYSTAIPSPPLTTNVSFAAGQTIASMAIVKVGGDGKIRLYNTAATGTIQVYVDAFGWTAATATVYQSNFVPTDPTRIPNQTIAAGATATIQISGVGGVPTSTPPPRRDGSPPQRLPSISATGSLRIMARRAGWVTGRSPGSPTKP